MRFCAVGAAAAVAMTATSAHADESAYCKKVRARASADAALLIAPTLRAEAMKLPTSLQPGGRIDATAGGSNYQIRAGGTLSVINMYKGSRLGAVADADCAAHDATTTAQDVLAQAADFGRLTALRGEAQFLDEKRPSWEAISVKMSERFAVQNVTLLNLEDVRARTTVLERRRVQVGGEIARIEATGLDSRRPSIAALISAIDSTTMKFERESSHVRSLDAWDLTVTGGYVPPVFDSKQSDFFGLVQISYSLGGPFHNAAESRYLDARAEELKTARYESQAQLRMFRQHVKGALTEARQELEIIQRRLAALESARGHLEGSEAPSAPYALAMLDLELIAVHADQTFLTGFVRELTHMEEN